MPIKFHIREERPNINTEFVVIPKGLMIEHRAYRFVSPWTWSADRLLREQTITYNSESDYNRVLEDPVVQANWKLTDDYNVANNIIVTKTQVSV